MMARQRVEWRIYMSRFSIIGRSRWAVDVEMQEKLLDQGVTLMLAGMGTVFVFLTILVMAMSLMSAIVNRIRPKNTDPTDEEVAAISAAIRRHRKP